MSVIPFDHLRAFLQNGVGRYICPLQRITLKFCKERADTLGMREYIDTRLVDFARANPGVVVYLQPRRHRPPIIVAEYLHGKWQYVHAAKMNALDIEKWVESLRTRSGYDVLRVLKRQHTNTPSIQGTWHPFLNKPHEVAAMSFPNEARGAFKSDQPSATEKIRQIYLAAQPQVEAASPKVHRV